MRGRLDFSLEGNRPENPKTLWIYLVSCTRVQSRGKVALLHSCILDLVTHRPTIAPFQKTKDLKKECT
jgi:hypothetical protein